MNSFNLPENIGEETCNNKINTLEETVNQLKERLQQQERTIAKMEAQIQLLQPNPSSSFEIPLRDEETSRSETRQVLPRKIVSSRRDLLKAASAAALLGAAGVVSLVGKPETAQAAPGSFSSSDGTAAL